MNMREIDTKYCTLPPEDKCGYVRIGWGRRYHPSDPAATDSVGTSITAQ